MKLNLTARAAHWSAGHWKTATAAWIAFVAVAVGLGTVAGKVGLSDSEQSTGETARAESILQDAGFKQPAGESVLIQNAHAAADGGFAATVHRVVAELKAQEQVKNLLAPVTSKDGHSVLVNFAIRGDASSAADRIQPVLNTVANLQRGSPHYTIVESGDASGEKQVGEKMDSDLQKAEQLSLPITFLILLFAFGAFVAAGIPVLLAFSAVLASIGVDALTSHVWHASDAASSVTLLIGMAVGVDYSLFYVKREREERRAGLSGRDAVTRAGATSGLAVLVSGATVLIAMAGMLISGSAIFASLGIASMVVVGERDDRIADRAARAAREARRPVDRGVIGVLAATLHRLARVVRVDSRLLARIRDRRTVLQRLKGDGSRSRIWEAGSAAGSPPSAGLGAGRDLGARRARTPRAEHAHEAAGARPTCRRASGHATPTRRSTRHFPARQIPAVVVVKARERRRTARAHGDRGAPARGDRDRRDDRAGLHDGQPRGHGRTSRDPAPRRRRRALHACTLDAAEHVFCRTRSVRFRAPSSPSRARRRVTTTSGRR